MRPSGPAAAKKEDEPARSWSVKAEDSRRIRALVVAGQDLLVAAAAAHRKGAVLSYLSKTDGRKIGQVELPAVPRWDGLAVADDRLYISTEDGRVLCLGKK